MAEGQGAALCGCAHCRAYGELYSAARDVLDSTHNDRVPPTLASLERLRRFFTVSDEDAPDA